MIDYSRAEHYGHDVILGSMDAELRRLSYHLRKLVALMFQGVFSMSDEDVEDFALYPQKGG